MVPQEGNVARMLGHHGKHNCQWGGIENRGGWKVLTVGGRVEEFGLGSTVQREP